MIRTYERTPKDPDKINMKTALLDAERNKERVTFYTFTRHFIDKFTCIDHPNKPITLNNFFTSGGLIYYKENAFSWRTISLDNIEKIEIHSK